MNWIQRNFRSIIYISFLIPILSVAIVSISHVTTWYQLSSPVNWALYLSIGIEVAALSALAAIAVNMGSRVYLPFIIVTLIQFIGNIFYCYQYIDVESEMFKDWVELSAPLVSYLGVEIGDIVGHKRILSVITGGILPLISLTFLHMLVRYEEEGKKVSNVPPKPNTDNDNKYDPTEDELNKLEQILSEINKRKFGQNLNLVNNDTPTDDIRITVEAPDNEDIVKTDVEVEKSVTDELIPESLSTPNDVVNNQPEVNNESIEIEPDFYKEDTPDYDLENEEPVNKRRLIYSSSR